MELMAREFKVKPANTYKSEGSIYAQISKNYFNGTDGVIRLIKNSKIGKVGKGNLYCTIEDAVKSKLTIDDVDMDKVWSELGAFVKNEN